MPFKYRYHSKHICTVVLLIFLAAGCTKESDPAPSPPDTSMYFPPITGTSWDTTPVSDLGWNENAIGPLKDFLAETNTKSFMILVNGRIVMEEYFNGHTASDTWQWNSAGKTLISATTGIASQEGLLSIGDKVSDHLGTGWTAMPLEKENLIQVGNLLSMTSGIDDSKQLVTTPNLTYLADAGTRWAYGNVFQKLFDVVDTAAPTNFETYFREKLEAGIGMEGFWNFGTVFTVYHSNTRSMARFGLLALNHGKWEDQQVLEEDFFIQSIHPSQELNPSYGYLWWLNGQSNYMLPGSQEIFNGPLVPNAPADMYAAMGLNEQRIYVVPGKNMVIIRMGEASGIGSSDLALSGFDNTLWAYINTLVN